MATLVHSFSRPPSRTRRILGLDFFGGTAAEAIAQMRLGGLLVVPAAPALMNLVRDSGYREALLGADLCIADSAYMVSSWNLLQRDSLRRLSGLEYLRALLREEDVRQPGNTVWVMASLESARQNVKWLAGEGIVVPEGCVHVAPRYENAIEDASLLGLLNELQPRHVIVTVGGGTQERLGLHIKGRLTYRPAIHCIGSAIAFLSGDQVHIPVWADYLLLGWLFRSVSRPSVYLPRYWSARNLPALIFRHRSEMPPPVRGRA